MKITETNVNLIASNFQSALINYKKIILSFRTEENNDEVQMDQYPDAIFRRVPVILTIIHFANS